MRLVLDEMDDAVHAADAALPERLYVIEARGRVVYRSEPGLLGFHPDAWEEAIEKQLGAGA